MWCVHEMIELNHSILIFSREPETTSTSKSSFFPRTSSKPQRQPVTTKASICDSNQTMTTAITSWPHLLMNTSSGLRSTWARSKLTKLLAQLPSRSLLQKCLGSTAEVIGPLFELKISRRELDQRIIVHYSSVHTVLQVQHRTTPDFLSEKPLNSRQTEYPK